MTTPTIPNPDAHAFSQRANDFNHGWRFFRGTPNGAEKPDYDDDAWRTVTLPHDYGVEGRFSRNARATVGYLKVGEGWYRKTFTAPTTLAGKRATLDFDGVMDRAEIWLNGERIAEHHYGYTAFSVDLTGRLRLGEENVVTVRSNNEEPSSRWYAGAGIYRDVTLTVTEPVHVARFGTQVTTPTLETDVKDHVANVRVATIIANETADDRPVILRNVVIDADGTIVASVSEHVTVPANHPDTTHAAAHYDDADAANRYGQTVAVPDPHLWSTADPYRYTLRTIVIDAANADGTDGMALDMMDTQIGLRWITLDPASGLYLNGVNMRALGMCMHHDLGALGAATYRRAVVRQLEILKDAGVNAIRTSHNPCSKVWAEECSRMGFLLLEELTDMWTAPKNRNDYSNYFATDYPEDLAAMILRDRNEPAIFMWGIGNEVAWQESEIPIAADLTRRCHLLDPTRPNSVNDASYLSKGIDGIGNKIHEQMDVRGYSYINRDQMEQVHERHPNDVILNSESGNCTPCRGFYVHPTILTDEWQLRGRDYPFAKGRRPWTEDTYEISDYNVTTNRGYPLDIAFDRLVNLPFNVGEFAWTGFDYIGEPAPYISNFYWNKPQMPESDGSVLAPLRSYYGMVDTAGFPKNPWWLYKALWTDPDDAPMIHLLPHWNWDESESVAVWAYTNAASAELFVNGRSLGRREFESHEATFHLSNKYADKPFEYRYQKNGNEEKQLTLQWEVPFEPGTVSVVAYDKAGNAVARDSITTAGTPAGIRLIPDRHVIDGDGHDLSFIEADVIDDAGVIVPRANNEIVFHVEHGRLLGTDNGYQANTEPLQSPVHSAYSGKVLAIVASDGSGQPIRVTATAKGLRSDSVDVFLTEEEHLRPLKGELSPKATEGVTGETTPITPSVSDADSSPFRGSKEADAANANSPSSAADTAGATATVLAVRDAAVRVRAGETPSLPQTVTALLADNTRTEVSVEWATADLLDKTSATESRSGAQSFVVDGEATGLPVHATVTVTHPIAVRPVTLAAAAGAEPALPSRVLVVFDDGSETDTPVAWQPVPQSTWATPGIVTLSGTPDDYDLPVTATVRVADATSPAAASATAAETPAPIAHDTTDLTAIIVDGVPIAGFTADAHRYTLRRAYTDPAPVIEVTTAGNATAYVVPPLHYPYGSYVVRVTSEDGEQHGSYALDLDVPPAPVAEVTLTPPTCTLSEDETTTLTVSASDEVGNPIELSMNDDVTVTFASGDEAVAGVAADDTDKAKAVVQARLSGVTQITATVTYGGATVSGTPTIITVAAGSEPKSPVRTTVATTRTVVGTVPTLPATATVTFGHGVDAPLPIVWEPASDETFDHAGEVTLRGTIARFNRDVTTTVQVVEVVAVQTVALATITGIEPLVQETVPEVTVHWSDGTKEQRRVTWDIPDPSTYRHPGTFSLLGTVEGIDERAVAHVRVTDNHVQNRDLFSYRNDVYPQVRASYTNPDPKAQEDSSLLMDGIVSYTPRVGYNLKNRWSTTGNPSRTASLEYRFGYGEETPFILDAFTVYYCLDGEHVALPKHVDIEYLDANGSWRPVRNLAVASHPVEQTNDAAWVYATVGDKPGSSMSSKGDETTYSFDMVRTSRMRITFESAPGEVVAITEVRGDAQIPALNSDATIAGLLVDGEVLPGFDPAAETVHVAGRTDGDDADPAGTAGHVPTIETLPTGTNAAVTVVPGTTAGDDETQVIVVSEDGTATRTYHVVFDK
ncbi:Ig-like domain-containing protein [Bifidobacterium amazonense]|uniref:Ig-like domain-containing protein n=1 Tax=Bifidobacterium amazonense TaxID=2809027 RepID=A0ABS9VYH3_9BIFI|nr:Ig-like domain-containing protein [Bifidobacterium amazonense]MCH9277108.1 Ig-like domain-containing protein [Bifidobacterium amazonense]